MHKLTVSAHRMGRLGAAAALLLLVAACATPQPVTQVGLNRDTPEATYAYFKAVARANQWAAEWSVFSPDFKRAMNQSVGRNIDIGDYVTARQTIATNGQADMRLLLASQLGDVQMLGPERARVTITGGGRSLTPTFVKLTRWELKIAGEDEPASGFITSPGDAVAVNADGSVTVRVRANPAAAAYLRTIPRDRIEGFAIKSEWFVDDFGGLGTAVGSQTGREGAPAAPQPGSYAPSPQPLAPAPTAPTAPAPDPIVGSGSPDG
jgi:hypothetical protein